MGVIFILLITSVVGFHHFYKYLLPVFRVTRKAD